MADPFADYGRQATSQAPARLLGPIATRKDARARYAEIVGEMAAISDGENLEIYLLGIERETAQFAAELDFFWEGDGADFRGMRKEIEWARARVDDGKDFPRWEFLPVSEQGLDL